MAVDRAALIEQLRKVFHTYGYDGTSLSRISAETGLGKGSLYLQFPGGKDEMAAAVLSAEGDYFYHALQALLESGSPLERLQCFIQRLRLNPMRRQEASTLDVYSMGEARERFGHHMGDAARRWIAALQGVLQEAGLPQQCAWQRAVDAISRIEGTRLLCRCLNDWQVFEQLMDDLPKQLLLPDR